MTKPNESPSEHSSPLGGSCQNLEHWVLPYVSPDRSPSLPDDSSSKTQKLHRRFMSPNKQSTPSGDFWKIPKTRTRNRHEHITIHAIMNLL